MRRVAAAPASQPVSLPACLFACPLPLTAAAPPRARAAHFRPRSLRSFTLEYAQNDDTVATLARWLGDAATEALYRNRSQWFRNVWVANNSAFYPRYENGSFSVSTDLYYP